MAMSKYTRPRSQHGQGQDEKDWLDLVENDIRPEVGVRYLTKDYAFNDVSSLKRLMKIVDEEDMIRKVSNKNSTTVFLTPATYLYAQKFLIEAFKKDIRGGHVNLRKDVDGKGKVVNYLFEYDKFDRPFKAHLYNTTCKIMINGKGYKIFNRYIDMLSDSIIGKEEHLEKENDDMKKELENMIKSNAQTAKIRTSSRRNVSRNILDPSDCQTKTRSRLQMALKSNHELLQDMEEEVEEEQQRSLENIVPGESLRDHITESRNGEGDDETDRAGGENGSTLSGPTVVGIDNGDDNKIIVKFGANGEERIDEKDDENDETEVEQKFKCICDEDIEADQISLQCTKCCDHVHKRCDDREVKPYVCLMCKHELKEESKYVKKSEVKTL